MFQRFHKSRDFINKATNGFLFKPVTSQLIQQQNFFKSGNHSQSVNGCDFKKIHISQEVRGSHSKTGLLKTKKAPTVRHLSTSLQSYKANCLALSKC